MQMQFRRRGIFASIVIIALCVILAVGSTFSLFTSKDDVTIDVNSATVNVVATLDSLMAKSIGDTDYKSVAKYEVLNFGNVGTSAQITTNEDGNDHLAINNIAPGDEVKVQVVITNTSTISIAYRVNITTEYTNANGEVVSAPGTAFTVTAAQAGERVAINEGFTEWSYVEKAEDEIKPLDVTLTLPVEAGNEYQGFNMSVAFTVEAVQSNATTVEKITTPEELYTALYMNGVAVLESDIALTRPLVIEEGKTAELYLAGHTLSIANGDAIVNNGALTVYPGEPVATYSLRSTAAIGAVISENGSAIVNNGELAIAGGSFVGTGAAAIVTAENTELVITEGNFESFDEDGNELTDFAIKYAVAENVTISGGSFSGEIATEELDKIAGDGMGAIEDENGNIVFIPMFFKIGAKSFPTLEEVMAAAVTGDTITIIADLNDLAIEVNKSLTFTGNVNLNNVTFNAVDGAEELTVSGLTFSGNSWINSGKASKLTVSDVTANVTPSNTAQTNSRSAFISLGSSEQHTLALTVENCNIVSRGGSDPVLGWAAITEANLVGNTFGSESEHQSNSDSVKFMAIADGATFNVKNNTVYSDYNGIVFGQNTTRNNAYSVYVDGNTFIGVADHIWIEISGGTVCNGSFNITSNNTVNGNAFTKADIKVHTVAIKSFSGYAGMNVVLNSEGKVIGGNLAYYGAKAIATGYQVDANGEVFANIIKVESVEDLFEKLASDNYTSAIIEMPAGLNTQDNQISETIIINKEVVINPNGMYLVSNAPATFKVVEGGKLIISEGAFTVKNTSTDGACILVDGGEFVMEGGSFDGHTAVRTVAGKSSVVTLAAGWSNRVTVGFDLKGNDTLNGTGGSLYAKKEIAKTVAGTHTYINISGGTLSGSTDQYSAVFNIKGTVDFNMTGGTIESTYLNRYNGSPAIKVVVAPSVINISGTAKVTSNGIAILLGDSSYAPEVHDDRFTLNVSGDATISANSDMGFGIRFAQDCCDVTISGNATVNATFQAIQMNSNNYVFSNSTLTIAENAKIISSAGGIGGGYAIAANGNVTITGGTINGSTAGLAVFQTASVIVIDNSVSGDAITINSVDIAEGVSYTVNGDPVIN